MGNEYYGAPTTPTSDYLVHYGVKGMKWGVRRALSSGNARALSRQYRKAQRKLAKLERRATSGKKYAKRAAALGAGAAGAGALAAGGTALAGRITNAVGQGMQTAGYGANRLLGKHLKGNVGNAIRTANSAVGKAGQVVSGTQGAINKWGNATAYKLRPDQIDRITEGVQKVAGGKNAAATYKFLNKNNTVSNNALARVGAGALGAGLAAGAGYNAYRAATTKRAAKKAAAFRQEMNRTFAGTKYANAPRTPQKKRRRG